MNNTEYELENPDRLAGLCYACAFALPEHAAVRTHKAPSTSARAKRSGWYLIARRQPVGLSILARGFRQTASRAEDRGHYHASCMLLRLAKCHEVASGTKPVFAAQDRQ